TLGNLPPLRPQQSRNRLERGRLPRPIRPQQRRDPTLPDVQRHTLENKNDPLINHFDVVQRQHVAPVPSLESIRYLAGHPPPKSIATSQDASEAAAAICGSRRMSIKSRPNVAFGTLSSPHQ